MTHVLQAVLTLFGPDIPKELEETFLVEAGVAPLTFQRNRVSVVCVEAF